MEEVMEKINIEKYPDYKDSGVEWLRKIPAHWEVYKGKWLFIKQERLARKEDGIITCFRDGEVTLRTNRKTEGFTIALKEHGYQGIRKGDFVIHNMDAFAGAIGVSDSDGKSTPVYSACTPRKINKINPYYFAYFLRDLAKSGFIQSLAKGIRERSTDFRFNDFGLLLLSVPPINEQNAIAQFLDRKTVLIDQAIGIKEKQIELLKERRQIIIHKAVTRGLNPKVKLKDSGLEWIGKIPVHWRSAEKLKYISSLKGRLGWQGLKAEEYTDEGPYIVSSAHFQNYNIEWDKCPHVSYERYLLDSNIHLQEGDVLVMKDGAKMGKLAFVENQPGLACLNSHLLLLRPIVKDGLKTYFPKFIFYLLETSLFQDYVLINGTGSTFLGISQESIGNYQICLPDYEEQVELVAFIETLSKKINISVNVKEREIDKLNEYKSSLINSAVTGKIKVC